MIYDDSRGFRVCRSFSPRVAERSVPRGRDIVYGDRIFVRLTMRSQVLLEFEVNDVCDYSQLMGALRARTRGITGLTQMYVRNMTRGWSITRPLKLYADRVSVRNRSLATPVASPITARREIPESVRLLYGL